LEPAGCEGQPGAIPVSPEVIAAARRGGWEIILTPSKPVPGEWFPRDGRDRYPLPGLGRGQQGPILAAAGANVTVLDNSPRQLAQDALVAERERLDITTVEGDMADLSTFPDGSFDLIVHPVSNCFAPEVRPVWKEAFRVLRRGGTLLAGFANPAAYLFDYELADRAGTLQVKYALPYSDEESLDDEEKARYLERGVPFESSHTLDDQIGGQIDVGFVIAGFYEDGWSSDAGGDALSKYMLSFITTRALKLTNIEY